jgi:asparagine synthase (glutamine-hydrolysing)
MCGIAGVYHFQNSKKVKEKELVKMRDTLVHRGPDDAGTYISPDEKVGLGTRRLKILDLSPKGHMPMRRRGAAITYNGEIYNFQELKKDLEKRDYKFESTGDTEVILNGYLEYGPEIINKLNGMFGLAIWDEDKQIFLAARDHVGIKPFYYAIQNGTFFFGSEIKAILAHPDFKKELSEEGVSYYLTFSSTPSPSTMFQGVKKLPPAHYLLIQNGKIEEKEYWNPVRPGEKAETEEYYIGKIRELLRDSIKSQMVSDVPFGCFLSGGIDSSTNAALMSEALGKPVTTFSVGSAGFEKYNEFQYSRQMAQVLRTKPHEILITEKHLDEFLPQYAYYADDPNGDQVCLPLFWLSKLAKDSGVTVIQIGEGSDEIFAGYDTYLKAWQLYNRWWKWLEHLPGFVKGAPFHAAKFLNNSKLEFAQEYMRRLSANQEPFWGNAIAFSDFQKSRLMSPQFKRTVRTSSYPIINRYYREISELDSEADFLKRLTYLELKHRLPELLLMRADKMAMAHSLEGRVPFLDKRLVEFALQIPTSIKLKDNVQKYILKKSVTGIIPDELIWRKKQGFATSMSEWMKPTSPTSEKLLGIIRNSKLKERGLLDYGYVEKLIKAHADGVEHNFRLWNLITLSLWYDYWFK